ncbi:hypothetical protein PIB30_036168 [Stylosanthes scabra]|uniref:Uncharacterized protein n=1 Tax=Stylosanthes scabra TaxID=79078 RepID=A0ABU6ZAW7_9FABA|nr:hypothetical protein [Stylosanthes scabra]
MDNQRIRILPASISNLQSLEELHLRGCIELETLPKKLRNLINLQAISITTKQSVLPEDDLAKLGLLQYLDIYECGNLESPFVGIKLPALRYLRIMRCENLKSLPLDTHHFPQLEDFIIDECGKFELSDEDEVIMDSVLRLKALFFCNVVNFPHSLQKYANTLQSLVFLRCFELEELPEWNKKRYAAILLVFCVVANIPHSLRAYANTLQTLVFWGCYELEALPEWVLNITCLKFLHIHSCPELMSLPNDIHRLKALEVLQIEGCPILYRKYQLQVGEYWHQISHIKHSRIFP